MVDFNSIAEEYDKWYDTPLGAFVDKVEMHHAFNQIDITPGMKVLDVGCGTGNYTSHLVELGCDVIGIDISDRMLAIAQQKVPNANFVNSSVYGMPFPRNHFDLIISMATFEFIKNPEAAYYEMKRVAKHGAKIFIGTINGNSSWGEHYQTPEIKNNSVFKHACFKSPSDLSNIDRDCFLSNSGCVYFPPSANENQLNWDYENELSLLERPSFITSLWQKEE